mgnify:CR=1 FL=1
MPSRPFATLRSPERMADIVFLNDSDELARLQATSFENTELGNARRLIAVFGEDLRFCVTWGKWLVWDGLRWVVDDHGEVERRFKRTILLMHAQARADAGGTRRSDLAEWALESETLHHIRAAMRLAQTEPGIAVEAADLDADPMLIGVCNGVVDLKCGTLVQSERRFLITKQCAVGFDPAAVCPTWHRFIGEVTCGDVDLQTYLQRVAGYCLTGRTNEQCFFVLWGSGANGKSVFLGILESLLKDYARNTPAMTLMGKPRSDGASPDLARLDGARLVAASEPPDGCRFAAETVKAMTGQDRIICRPLYRDFFEYEPRFKVVLATNHKPQVADDDEAMWRRIRLIPFRAVIAPQNRDRHLHERLQAELPGILNWAVQGATYVGEYGLGTAGAVSRATDSYRSEMDVFSDWLDECAIEDPGAKTPTAELRESCNAWFLQQHHRPLSAKKFTQRLEARGFQSDRTSKARCILGLALRDAGDATEGNDPDPTAADDSCDASPPPHPSSPENNP